MRVVDDIYVFFLFDFYTKVYSLYLTCKSLEQ